jgi:hypothetical protein
MGKIMGYSDISSRSIASKLKSMKDMKDSIKPNPRLKSTERYDTYQQNIINIQYIHTNSIQFLDIDHDFIWISQQKIYNFQPCFMMFHNTYFF